MAANSEYPSIKISLIPTQSPETIPSPLREPDVPFYHLLISPALWHITYVPILGGLIFLALLPLF